MGRVPTTPVPRLCQTEQIKLSLPCSDESCKDWLSRFARRSFSSVFYPYMFSAVPGYGCIRWSLLVSKTVKSREAVTLHSLLPSLIRLSTSIVHFYVQNVIGILTQILLSAELYPHSLLSFA